MATEKDSFYDKISGIKKLLVVDLGFLGDTIHMFPAFYCIRQALTRVELHVMVADHIKSIMHVTPWVDRVIGYPRFPKGPPWYKDISRVIALRKENYDAVINLNGSDRSSLLTWGIGAPLRLGRVPPKVPVFWKFCFTDTVSVPYRTMPTYRQRWRCLKEAGFPGERPEFVTEIPEPDMAAVEEHIGGERNFIHISPFTTADHRELPQAELAQLINDLYKYDPNIKIAITCANNDRERNKLEALVARLDKKPWKVFSGTLNLGQFAGLVSRAKLHFGGDTGAMHVALMNNTPSISWFREFEGIKEWLPEDGSIHRAFVGKETPEGVRGVSAEELLNAYKEFEKND